MATTITKTSSSTTLFSRGSSKTSMTQLTGCSVTRSSTTATLSKTSHGRSNGDIVFIAGFSLEEFNGVFTVANAQTNTFDYTIKQDPGANPGGTPGTVDLAVVSSTLDLTTAFGALIVAQLQNGTTGPTVAPTIGIGFAPADNEYDYIWYPLTVGSVTANINTVMPYEVSDRARYIRLAIWGNTAQAVDYSAVAHVMSSMSAA